MLTPTDSPAALRRLNSIEPTGIAVVIGAQAGGLCQLLKQRGWQISTIESPLDPLGFADGSAGLVVAFACLHHLEDPAALSASIARLLAPNGVYLSLATPTIGAATIESEALKRSREIDRDAVRCPTVRGLILELLGAGLEPTEVHSTLEDTLSKDQLRAAAVKAGAIWPGVKPDLLYRYFSLRRQALGSSRRNIKLLPAEGLNRNVLFWLDTTTEIWATKGPQSARIH